MADFVKVAQVQDIPPGQMRPFVVNGERVVIAQCQGQFHAFADSCTHDEGPLSEGELEGCRVTCPWHFSVFDITTGEVLESPAPEPIRTYAVRTEGDAIFVGPAK